MSSSTSTTSTESGSEYRVLLTRHAAKELEALDNQTRERIRKRLKELRLVPRGGPGCTQLVGQEGFRVKVGNWRALYIVLDEVREVRVTRILRRNERTY